MNFFSIHTPRILECKPANARRSLFGDDLKTFDDARNDHMLQSVIEIFRIFSHDNNIDVLKACFNSRQILDWPQVGEKLETFSQCHVNAWRAAGDGRCHWSLERYAVAPDCFQRIFLQKPALNSRLIRTRLHLFPLNIYSGSLNNS